jgi:DNA replication protein DnaC
MTNTPKYIYVEENGEIFAKVNPLYEKEVLKAKYNLHLKHSLIPQFYWDIEFEDYQGNKLSKTYKNILTYSKNLKDEKFKHVNLYLYGLHSSQKTALAINILKEGIKQGYKVRFVLANVLIDSLMKLQGFKFDNELDIFIKDLKSSDLLVIDDSFNPNTSLIWKKSENNNMILSEWDSFLRGMLTSSTRIIFTSNFAPEVIKQYFGETLFELVDRNCVALVCDDVISDYKKNKLSDVFKDI